MATKDISEAVSSGRTIVVGIVVIAVTVAIGIYIVNTLNATSGGLGVAVEMVNKAVSPISGGLQFLGLSFLVLVAVFIIRILQRANE